MESERILYSEISSKDKRLIHLGLSDKRLTKYYGVHFNSLDETQEQMKWYEELRRKDSGIWFKLELKETDTFVGAIGYNDWDKSEQCAEIGCWILPGFWGKGYGTEAMKRALTYGFVDMRLRKVNGFVDSKNDGIKKVLKKLNFEHLKSSIDTDSKNDTEILVDHFQLIN